MTRISVVIPTFNRAADLPRCLDALLAQTFQDFEVLVCDDGSTDATPEVVRSYQTRLNLQYHWSENFGGPARPRNIGLRLAQGEYIALLDSDDWWMPRKLEESVRFLENGAQFVYHDLYLSTHESQTHFRRKSPTRQLPAPVFDSLLRAGNVINNSSVVVRRSLLQQIGGFSEDLNLVAGEDYDAWLRVARYTDAFVRIPDTLGYYWTGTGNISNPRRTVLILEEMERRYAADIARLGGLQWIGYTKARANLLLGKHDAARSQLAALNWSGAPWGVLARGLMMRIQLGFRKSA